MNIKAPKTLKTLGCSSCPLVSTRMIVIRAGSNCSFKTETSPSAQNSLEIKSVTHSSIHNEMIVMMRPGWTCVSLLMSLKESDSNTPKDTERQTKTTVTQGDIVTIYHIKYLSEALCVGRRATEVHFPLKFLVHLDC